MALDPVPSELVMFGGFDPAYVEDTWTYDDTNWTQKNPTKVPAARSGSSAVFDAAQLFAK